jgi:hypothetical protein
MIFFDHVKFDDLAKILLHYVDIYFSKSDWVILLVYKRHEWSEESFFTIRDDYAGF